MCSSRTKPTLFLLILVSHLVYITLGAWTQAPIFSDEFNENEIDRSKWDHEITMGGGGNWEFQIYLDNRSSTFTENGKLHIRPFLTEDMRELHGTWDLWNSCTAPQWYGCFRHEVEPNVLPPIVSGKIFTKNSFSFKYGKVQFQAKLPRGDWLWPAVWLLPKDLTYGDWPASGEIDCLESGGLNYPPSNPEAPNVYRVTSALHWGAYYPSKWPLTHGSHPHQGAPPSVDYSAAMHLYELEWTPDYIRSTVDGNEIMYISMSPPFFDRGDYPPGADNPWRNGGPNAPFDQEYYVIINLAVGGTTGYWPPPTPWGDNEHAMRDFWTNKAAWLPSWEMENPSTRTFELDYIRVYGYVPDEEEMVGEGGNNEEDMMEKLVE